MGFEMNNKSEEDKGIKAADLSNIHMNCFAKAALTVSSLHGFGKILDTPTIMQGFKDGAKRVTDDDTKEIEQMLYTHAKTMDYVFYDALEKLSKCNMINQIETYANIAFRAQNQSRKTLLALADLKNPHRATFIKQQNNAINQQINNKPAPELEILKIMKMLQTN